MEGPSEHQFFWDAANRGLIVLYFPFFLNIGFVAETSSIKQNENVHILTKKRTPVILDTFSGPQSPGQWPVHFDGVVHSAHMPKKRFKTSAFMGP